MNTITFDTLKYANRLKKAGVPPEQAEEQASALSEAFEVNLKDLATKGDLAELKKDLQLEIAPIKADILLLKWMVGVIVAGVVALVIKAFLRT